MQHDSRAPGSKPETPALLDAATETGEQSALTPAVLREVERAWTLGGPNYVPYRVALLAKMIDRQTTRLLSDSAGISLAEWRVLGQLTQASPATVRSLADNSWVDRAEVSRAAASLEQAGYVERRDNPADRRSTLFSLTPAGLALIERLRPLRQEFHTSLTGKLTEAQRKTLDDALLILAHACMERLWAQRDNSDGESEA